MTRLAGRTGIQRLAPPARQYRHSALEAESSAIASRFYPLYPLNLLLMRLLLLFSVFFSANQ